MIGKDLRIVFMGTPEFAVASLRRIVEEGYNVVAVVTTPDKPAGRGQKIHESDVKVAAKELGLPILQPEKLRDPEFVKAMEELKPDLGIVIAFRMLPEVIWAMPKYGTFNLHASLLPQYRGAAPINWAIINGEEKTGITTFLLNHEIDKGAIIGQHEEPILPEDNIGTMYDKLMTKGCDLVVETIEKIASGDYKAIEQMHIDESTLKPAPKIFKDDCKIDWSWQGERIVNFVRGLSPYPAAWTSLYLDGEEKSSAKIFEVKFEPKESAMKVGEITSDSRDEIAVRCADGLIHILSMQMAGKRRMSNHDLLLGFRDIESYTCK
ncbi:MAG: methionyl-tRNA formyltransferase [Alistipes sp.]|nr:methionyl-tRNA formyltransferase [Alistipes sp.]